MPKRKKPTRKTTPRRQVTAAAYRRWVQTRVYAYDDEVYERPTALQTCLNCYQSYEYDWNRRFDIRNRFCTSCRVLMPFKKWLVLRKFYRVLEEALNKREPDNDITRGSMMQYANGVFQSLKNNKSREYLLDTISCTVDVAHLSTPLELAQMMEIYDLVTDAKQKPRVQRKKRYLQRHKKTV